jgi:hypothetical protein
MTVSTPPLDSLHSVLVYLETERRHYEETEDVKRHDHVYHHAAKVREWLSSVHHEKPGITIVAENPDGPAPQA